MKKIITTMAILLGLSLPTFADPTGGLFNRGNNMANGGGGSTYFNSGTRDGGVDTPALPPHGESGNQDAPLGSGIVLLTALGAAYLVSKRRKEE